jgi:two-component system nitrogen regulation response regulator GlnG
MELLARYPWPGHVRDLQSVLKRAVLQASLPVLLPDDLPADLNTKQCCAVDFESYVDGRLHAGSTALHAEALDYMERVVLTRVLRHTAGNQSRAARILHITRGTLRSRIRQLGINIRQAVNVEAGSPDRASF